MVFPWTSTGFDSSALRRFSRLSKALIDLGFSKMIHMIHPRPLHRALRVGFVVGSRLWVAFSDFWEALRRREVVGSDGFLSPPVSSSSGFPSSVELGTELSTVSTLLCTQLSSSPRP